ncbi:hypothetical protein ACFL34_03480 [Candidatus Sumerlaeota bacterium]
MKTKVVVWQAIGDEKIAGILGLDRTTPTSDTAYIQLGPFDAQQLLESLRAARADNAELLLAERMKWLAGKKLGEMLIPDHLTFMRHNRQQRSAEKLRRTVEMTINGFAKLQLDGAQAEVDLDASGASARVMFFPTTAESDWLKARTKPPLQSFKRTEKLLPGQAAISLAPMVGNTPKKYCHFIVVQAVGAPEDLAEHLTAVTDSERWVADGPQGALNEIGKALAWAKDGAVDGDRSGKAKSVVIRPMSPEKDAVLSAADMSRIGIVAIGRPAKWPHHWWDVEGRPVAADPTWQGPFQRGQLSVVYNADHTLGRVSASFHFPDQPDLKSGSGSGGAGNVEFISRGGAKLAAYLDGGGRMDVTVKLGRGAWTEIGAIHEGKTVELDGGTFQLDKVKATRSRQKRLLLDDTPGVVHIDGHYDYDPDWEVTIVAEDQAGNRAGRPDKSGLSSAREGRRWFQQIEMDKADIARFVILKRRAENFVIEDLPTTPNKAPDAQSPTKPLEPIASTENERQPEANDKLPTTELEPQLKIHALAFETIHGLVTDEKQRRLISLVRQPTEKLGRVYIRYPEFKDGVSLAPASYTAQMHILGPGGHGSWELAFPPVNVTEETPREIMFKEPPARSFSGRVIHGVTGEPIPGAFIIGSYTVSDKRFSEIAEEEWTRLRELPLRPAIDDEALDILGRVRPYDVIVRANELGGFVMERRSQQTYNFTVVAQDFMPFSVNLWSHKLPAEGPVKAGDIRLFPAARVKLGLTNPGEIGQILPIPIIDRESAPDWATVFQPFVGFSYDQWHRLGLPRWIFVPAGTPFKLKLRPSNSKRFGNLVMPEVLNLRQGETRDLGFATLPNKNGLPDQDTPTTDAASLARDKEVDRLFAAIAPDPLHVSDIFTLGKDFRLSLEDEAALLARHPATKQLVGDLRGNYLRNEEVATERLAKVINTEPYFSEDISLLRTPSGLRSAIANALKDNAARLSPVQLAAIARHLIENDDPNTCGTLHNTLFLCINLPGHKEALLTLAGSEKPWLWWRAMHQMRDRTTPGMLTPVLRERLSLVREYDDRYSDGHEHGALTPSMLTTLETAMTPRYLAMSMGHFSEVLRFYADSADPERATTFSVEFLQRLLNEWDQLLGAPNHSPPLAWGVLRMTKYINLWQGTNIGGVGNKAVTTTGEEAMQEHEELRKHDWRAVAAEVIRLHSHRLTKASAAGAVENAHEAPRLRIVNTWSDPEQAPESLVAWQPAGGAVRYEEERRLLADYPSGISRSASMSDPTPLGFWFYHPDFDDRSEFAVFLRDIEPTVGFLNNDPETHKRFPGWRTMRLLAEAADLPERGEVELRYSLGPWTYLATEIQPDQRGEIAGEPLTINHIRQVGSKTTEISFTVKLPGAGQERQYDVVGMMAHPTTTGTVVTLGRLSHESRLLPDNKGARCTARFYLPPSEIKHFLIRWRKIERQRYQDVAFAGATHDASAEAPQLRIVNTWTKPDQTHDSLVAWQPDGGPVTDEEARQLLADYPSKPVNHSPWSAAPTPLGFWFHHPDLDDRSEFHVVLYDANNDQIEPLAWLLKDRSETHKRFPGWRTIRVLAEAADLPGRGEVELQYSLGQWTYLATEIGPGQWGEIAGEPVTVNHIRQQRSNKTEISFTVNLPGAGQERQYDAVAILAQPTTTGTVVTLASMSRLSRSRPDNNGARCRASFNIPPAGIKHFRIRWRNIERQRYQDVVFAGVTHDGSAEAPVHKSLTARKVVEKYFRAIAEKDRGALEVLVAPSFRDTSLKGLSQLKDQELEMMRQLTADRAIEIGPYALVATKPFQLPDEDHEKVMLIRLRRNQGRWIINKTQPIPSAQIDGHVQGFQEWVHERSSRQ